MGLVPPGLKLPEAVMRKSWDSLDPKDQALYAKKMSVFAAMLDSADQHIGPQAAGERRHHQGGRGGDDHQPHRVAAPALPSRCSSSSMPLSLKQHSS